MTFALSNIKTFTLSNVKTFTLSNVKTFALSNVETFALSNVKTFTLSGRPLLPNLHDLPLSLCLWMAPGCRDPLQSLWRGR